MASVLDKENGFSKVVIRDPEEDLVEGSGIPVVSLPWGSHHDGGNGNCYGPDSLRPQDPVARLKRQTAETKRLLIESRRKRNPHEVADGEKKLISALGPSESKVGHELSSKLKEDYFEKLKKSSILDFDALAKELGENGGRPVLQEFLGYIRMEKETREANVNRTDVLRRFYSLLPLAKEKIALKRLGEEVDRSALAKIFDNAYEQTRVIDSDFASEMRMARDVIVYKEVK